MLKYLLRQLLVVLPLTLLGATTIVFFIIHLVPGDPVVSIMQDYYTRDSYEQVRHNLGLDRPLAVQYADYVWGVVRFDLGTSFLNKRPVSENIAGQIMHTVNLALASIVVAILIALPAGITAAVYHNRWPDFLSMGLALIAVSSPVFVIAVGLVLVFSLKLGWLPAFGVGAAGTYLAHLVLPALAQGARSAALLARITRSSFLETLGRDFVRTARAKGLRYRAVLLRHVTRNALSPIVTVIGMDIAYLLGGAVVIETVFSRQGVGRLLLNAILTRDYPQIQGTLLVFIAISITVNTLVDVVYGVIDPRIRYS